MTLQWYARIMREKKKEKKERNERKQEHSLSRSIGTLHDDQTKKRNSVSNLFPGHAAFGVRFARRVTHVSQAAVMAEVDETDLMMNYHGDFLKGDRKHSRYPYCIVWTPIPLLTWVLPFIGHMGICTSTGVIRDFAGSYYVSEDNMGFGRPTKYWKLDVDKVCGNGAATWDKAVHDASEEYKSRPHNLCFDNCHSHVAMALNLMRYDNSTSWNMVNLCALSLIHGKHVSWAAFFKTWLPFVMLSGVLTTFILTFHLH